MDGYINLGKDLRLKMKRKQHRQHEPGRPKTTVMQLGILVGVLLLIGVVLIVKMQKPSADASAIAWDITATEPSVTATAVSAQSLPTPALLPEAQLDQLLAAGKPTLAFFHSTTCVPCIKMTQIVQEVYPEFAESVALVDVNVYDKRNASLLQRARIRAIPTLIFIDRTGQGRGYMGVMEPDALREQLQALAGE